MLEKQDTCTARSTLETPPKHTKIIDNNVDTHYDCSGLFTTSWWTPLAIEHDSKKSTMYNEGRLQPAIPTTPH